MNAFFKYLMIFSLTVLFGTGLIFFISGMQTANDSEENILNNPSLANLNSTMNSFMSNFSSGTQVQKNSSLSEQSINPTGAILMPSILTSLGRFISLPITFTISLFSAISSMLGIDPAILGFVASIIVLAGIFAWYRSLKQG
jgi:hypothetical protein